MSLGAICKPYYDATCNTLKDYTMLPELGHRELPGHMLMMTIDDNGDDNDKRGDANVNDRARATVL